jgi:hypothetical protein
MGFFFSVYLRAALRVDFPFFSKKYVPSCAYSSYEPDFRLVTVGEIPSRPNLTFSALIDSLKRKRK